MRDAAIYFQSRRGLSLRLSSWEERLDTIDSLNTIQSHRRIRRSSVHIFVRVSIQLRRCSFVQPHEGLGGSALPYDDDEDDDDDDNNVDNDVTAAITPS